jgi:hypothetical protein
MYQSFVSLSTHFSPISEQQFFSKEVKAKCSIIAAKMFKIITLLNGQQ